MRLVSRANGALWELGCLAGFYVYLWPSLSIDQTNAVKRTVDFGVIAIGLIVIAWVLAGVAQRDSAEARKSWWSWLGATLLWVTVVSGWFLSKESPGHEIVLGASGKQRNVWVLKDRSSDEELKRLATSPLLFNSRASQLERDGQLLHVPNGTRALILKYEWSQYQVRLLQGEHSGSEGWTFDLK
jgi:hypothetical protein